MARILVVEDNPINLELMTYLLQAWQHQTLIATDGEQGLAVARAEKPDLILCDLQMPRLDGPGVARALRAEAALRHVPLVAVTALARDVDRERALAAGFDAVFSKPIDPPLLMRELQRFLPGQIEAPAQAEPTLGMRRVPIPAPLRAPRQPCVLLTVDDGPVNVEYKHDLLAPAGYTVLDAGGVASALALLRREPVDLVLSDVMMADGGGFELLRRVRADPAWRDLPFVFLTSTAREAAARAHGLALGAQDFLVRPLEATELLGSIRRALTGRG